MAVNEPEDFSGAIRKGFGKIQGIEFGHTWETREQCRSAGVHTEVRAGISGNAKDGARSIVLSGGYPDDEDHGDMIIYSGEGGRDNDSGEIVQDQDPERGHNKALYTSLDNRHRVRVIRGPSETSPYAPEQGYRYDGLYTVDDEEFTPGKNRGGFRVCKFTLKRYKKPGEVLPEIPRRW